MECLHCGDCCLRMSPLATFDEECPFKDGTFYFCSEYEDRPKQCQDHDFPSDLCPIGISKLGLKTEGDIKKRIEDGYNKIRADHD